MVKKHNKYLKYLDKNQKKYANVTVEQIIATRHKKRVIIKAAIAFIILIIVVLFLAFSGDKKDPDADMINLEKKAYERPKPIENINEGKITERLPDNRNLPLAIKNRAEGGLPLNDNSVLPNEDLDKIKPYMNTNDPKDDLVNKNTYDRLVPVGGTTLYCDTFTSEQAAQEQKARLAFEGVISHVVIHDGTHKLMLGPFENRDQAKNEFNELSKKKLLSRCILVE